MATRGGRIPKTRDFRIGRLPDDAGKISRNGPAARVTAKDSDCSSVFQSNSRLGRRLRLLVAVGGLPSV